MKYIKKYKVFENSVSYSKIKELVIPMQNSITDLLNDDRFQPHVDHPSDSKYWDFNTEPRKFNIGVSSNDTKFGTTYDIDFRTAESVNLRDLNEEIKFCYMDILELILDLSGVSGGSAVISKFSYFGHEIEGKKNGHTRTVEDITDRVGDLVNELGSSDIEYNVISKIKIQYTIK